MGIYELSMLFNKGASSTVQPTIGSFPLLVLSLSRILVPGQMHSGFYFRDKKGETPTRLMQNNKMISVAIYETKYVV